MTLFILLLINTIFGISCNKVGASASTIHAQTLAQTIITDEPVITILTHGLICCDPANLGFVFGAKNNDNITVCTENGSYCLPNGILVLVGDDVEAFQNGTLGFIEDYYRHSKKEFH